MKTAFKAAYSAAFGAVCMLPLVLKPFAGSNGNIEKKTDTAFPKLWSEGAVNTDFSADCESWLNENLPYRSELLSAAGFTKGELLHAPVSNVICGQDGWLFFNDEQADFMNTNALTDAQLRAVSVTLSLMEEQVRENGGRFLFVPMPNKSTVYAEYMPSCFQQAEENNLSRLTAQLAADRVSFLDMKQLMTLNKSTGVYHKRDTHWNYLGALIGYNAIMDALGAQHQTYEGSDFLYRRAWRGDLDKLLYPSGGFLDDQYYFQIAYQPFRFVGRTKEKDPLKQLEIFMSDKEDNDMRIVTQSLGNPQNDRLYMVRDSFGRALLPFMIDNYKNASFVRTNCPDLTQIVPGTDVVYEIVERNLKNVTGTAPYMYAPQRQVLPHDSYRDGGQTDAVCEDAGYAVRICGSLPADAVSDDVRVYVQLQNEAESCLYEAFPVCEQSFAEKGAKCGFSMYLPSESGLSGDYQVKIFTGTTRFSAGNIHINAE